MLETDFSEPLLFETDIFEEKTAETPILKEKREKEMSRFNGSAFGVRSDITRFLERMTGVKREFFEKGSVEHKDSEGEKTSILSRRILFFCKHSVNESGLLRRSDDICFRIPE